MARQAGLVEAEPLVLAVVVAAGVAGVAAGAVGAVGAEAEALADEQLVVGVAGLAETGVGEHEEEAAPGLVVGEDSVGTWPEGSVVS